MAEEIGIPVFMAREVSEDSWLHEERFVRDLAAVRYAGLKTHAIEALSKITPEEAVWLYKIMSNGYDFYDRQQAMQEARAQQVERSGEST